jgi:hypothetical protein
MTTRTYSACQCYDGRTRSSRRRSSDRNEIAFIWPENATKIGINGVMGVYSRSGIDHIDIIATPK